jgi:hypothetical protein
MTSDTTPASIGKSEDCSKALAGQYTCKPRLHAELLTLWEWRKSTPIKIEIGLHLLKKPTIVIAYLSVRRVKVNCVKTEYIRRLARNKINEFIVYSGKAPAPSFIEPSRKRVENTWSMKRLSIGAGGTKLQRWLVEIKFSAKEGNQ